MLQSAGAGLPLRRPCARPTEHLYNSISEEARSSLEYVHVLNFEGLSGSEDRGGGDNSIQFINFGRVGDKSFKEWRQKIGGWKGG